RSGSFIAATKKGSVKLPGIVVNAETWSGEVLSTLNLRIWFVVPPGPCATTISSAIPSPLVSTAATSTGELLLASVNAAKPVPFADRLDNVAAALAFHAQTSTSERPLTPAPTKMSGTREEVNRATSRDTPPAKVRVGVLKGVKLPAALGTVFGRGVAKPLTSKTFTVAFMPAPLPTMISAFPSCSRVSNGPFANGVLPMSAAATTAPPTNDDGNARNFR